MRFPDPSGVTSKEELRGLVTRLLTRWSADLDRDGVRLHFPRRRGLMRLIPEMPFHLYPELFLQISGYTLFRLPEETCRVGPGEICLISHGLPHREKIGTCGAPFFNIVITYFPDSIHFHLARQHQDGHPVIVVSTETRTVDGVHLAALLKNAADWFHEGDAPHRLAVKGSLLANLSMVLAAIRRPPTEAPEPLRVMQVRQLLMQHLYRPDLSVNWIGRSLRSNPDYLSRLFRETTGKPLASYITERRMLHARDLLTSSTLNISEISQASGYKDASYFTRVFRRETGLAPRQYRDHALKHSRAPVFAHRS